MSFDAVTGRIGFCENVYESSSEQSLDADISLPDYCPGIQRILKCDVNAAVTKVQVSGARVTADASATVRIIYAGEDGKIGCYEQSYPLQKLTESSQLEGACFVNVRVNTDYANCRAVSTRRVDVHAMLTFIFRAVKRREETVLSEVSGDGLQQRRALCETVSSTGAMLRSLPMGEVIEVSADMPPVFQIINISCSALAQDIKLINGKMLLKGTLNVKIGYIGEGCESVESLEHDMPISQIIELDGLNEDSIYFLSLDASGTQAIPKVDSSGNMRLVDVNVPLAACLYAWDRLDIEMINDVYSTDYEAQAESRSIELRRYIDSLSHTFVSKAAVDVAGGQPACVLNAWCCEPKYTVKSGDDGVTVVGTYTANVLYRDREGQTEFISKPIDFEHTMQVSTGSRMSCESSLQLLGCSCVVTADGKLEVKAELKFDAAVFDVRVERFVGEVSVNENVPKCRDDCALTVYYCGSNENLWDIAKHYNTGVDAIKAENGLDGDYAPDSAVLLIPR